MDRQPAVILKHTSHTVILADPRDPPVLPEDRHDVADAMAAIEILAGRLGSYQRLATIVRNLAILHDEQV